MDSTQNMSEDKKDAQVKVFIGRPGAGQQVDPNNLTTPVRFTLEVNQAFGESVEAFEERQGGLEAEFRKTIDIFHRVPENHRAMFLLDLLDSMMRSRKCTPILIDTETGQEMSIEQAGLKKSIDVENKDADK